jgi:hypothetical protein
LYWNLHLDSLCLRRERWLTNHHGWVKIPYRDGEHHVWKGKHRNYLEFLDSRWGVEEGNLSNGLRDFLPEGGEGIRDKWCSRVLKELLR